MEVMRVISQRYEAQKRVKKNSWQLRLVFLIFVVGIASSGVYFYSAEVSYFSTIEDNKKTTVVTNKVLRIFTGDEFKELYNNFGYSNTDKIIEPPIITGNEAADVRIRDLAEVRGYILRRVARDTLGQVDGLPLQQLATSSIQDMKTAALNDGLVLTVTSAFRTIEDQQVIFLDGLEANGATADTIARGEADTIVDKVLQTYAPPGYSRHHTGFTVDLTCGTSGLTNFATTACYEWLSRDNYSNTKIYGWAPSYPEGADSQGPEPESWEYVWVTKDSLIE